MGTAGSKQVKPAPAVDDDGHAKTPWLPNKARISSPPLQKVIVYNRKDQSLQIIPEDSLKRQLFPHISLHMLTMMTSIGPRNLPEDSITS